MADRVFTIPVGTPFLDRLAAGVWRQAGRDPLALTDVVLLLPTRRATRSAADTFLRLGDGQPMLLPQLRTIADVEEDLLDAEPGDEARGPTSLELPPSVPDLKRHLELTRLVLRFLERADPGATGTPRTPEHAFRLATALARLIDEVQMHGLDFTGLADLAPENYAEHWSITLRFLEIVTRFWPARLEELDAVDPVTRRDALMRAQAAAWRAAPPETPVIVAGSTGSVPATAELMRAVLELPQGAVVLPGLDQESDTSTWSAIGGDPTHPQFGLHQLLDRLEIDRAAVRLWDDSTDGAPTRAALMREVMRPAVTTDAWRALASNADPISPLALEGIRRIDAATPREEAGIIALLMREVLETPGKTAALVTPDRQLARRVAVELRRWDLHGSDGRRLTVDDSGGTPLAESPPAVFLRLLATALAESGPVGLLALLKHPLSACGREPSAFREAVRKLERSVLRGPRPPLGLAGLRTAAEGAALATESLSELLADLDRLTDVLMPLEAALRSPTVGIDEILTAHIRVAEDLASTASQAGGDRLWIGDAGEALATLVAEIADAASGLEAISGSEWPGFLDALLEGRVLRPRFGSHPRLHILGALEARLLSFDRVILGGLNEGTWPAEPPPDPWMSRPMRRSFGLPSPDVGIGKSAHDIAALLGAGEVFLTRAQRVDGTPTLPSRWLLRLETVARAIHGEDRIRPWTVPAAWHTALDQPEDEDPPAPPAPRPPLSARPRQLSVTRIETWLRDPYSIYASRILNLRALEELDADPKASERGEAIHLALDRFVTAHPRELPPDALDILTQFGEDSFAPHMGRPGVWAFWWPRFLRVARWFLGQERDRRPDLMLSATERKGSITLDGPAGPFTLTGTADRIDRTRDGDYVLIDYKTGTLPTKTDLLSGRAPQLPLEALILARGGFPDLDPGSVASLAYWRVGGGRPPGRIDSVDSDVAELVARAEAGLRELIAAFDDPNTPYHAIPDPGRAPRFNDYDHLARTGDWMTSDDADG